MRPIEHIKALFSQGLEDWQIANRTGYPYERVREVTCRLRQGKVESERARLDRVKRGGPLKDYTDLYGV